MNIMSLAQYNDFCQSFFNKEHLASEKNITALVNALSLQEYAQWYSNVTQSYYQEKYSFVRSLVSQIRGQYDVKTATGEDPLKTEENQKLFNSYRDIYNEVIDKNLDNLIIIIQKRQEWQEHLKEEAYQHSLSVNVQDIEFTAIEKCDVLWSGWECDNTAWIVEHEGQKKLVASNHGNTYFAERSFLEKKIKEYEQAIANSKKVLSLIS